MLSWRSCLSIFFLQALLVSGHSHAEVLKVQIQWQPEACNLTCAQLIGKQLQQVPGVAEIIMNQPGGYAELRWKPRYPFNYTAIQTAMQMVGVGMRTIRVKVRGTIQFQAQSVALISLGDNTPFYLLGQLNATPNQQTISDSLQNRQLSQAVLSQLAEGVKQNRVAVIEGPLYMPSNYTWLWLVVDQLQFVQPEAG